MMVESQDGVSVLIRTRRKTRALFLSSFCEDIGRMLPSASQEESLHQQPNWP
jgi:hypothetical protein